MSAFLLAAATTAATAATPTTTATTSGSSRWGVEYEDPTADAFATSTHAASSVPEPAETAAWPPAVVPAATTCTTTPDIAA